jgi:hypothetical protein
MKKGYQSLVMLLLVLAITSCTKDEREGDVLSKTPPPFPQVQNFDFNNDQVGDFNSYYSLWTWDGNNVSGDMIIGELIPSDQNTILFKQNTPSLFLQYNDVIKADMSEPYMWKNDRISLVSISTTPQYFWSKYWKASASSKQNDYYLGVKIGNGAEKLIGWLKVQVDTTSGAVTIKDRAFTNKDFIVVGK